MTEKHTRGSVIRGYVDYVRKTWGEAGVKELCLALNFDLGSIEDKQWYDEKLSADILDWIKDNKGLKFVELCGKHTIQHPGTLLAFLLKFMSVKSILKRAGPTFKEGFDYGEVDVEMLDDNRAVVYMKNVSVDENSCLAWLGALEGLLEMTGVKGTVKEIKCQRTGAQYCEFLMEWK